ncbi:MAG: Integrase core domain protein [Amycolatopsis sp.]|uniref:helix-turn-helix domain-containing protein n=1 Tax=Amycolatopsis sp. TaxID=37632 RepID=UPI0026234554|nr:helix-turn-helix domain-containing protein [Amycolatopsis sp.]MCU1681074.1 Integrase core domain protein [Amycolatopsis sp.]
MPRYAPNKLPNSVKKRYFELIRQGVKGAAAARQVGVSTNCGSLWFLDAGGMLIPDPGPGVPRFLDQDDRIAIADGLTAGLDKKTIAAEIGKSFQTVYREVQRNSKPDGTDQPWWAHNQAPLRRKRPKDAKVAAEPRLDSVVRRKRERKWSPQQIARFLRRTYPNLNSMQLCAETIYRALFAGLLGHKAGKLRTGRSRRKRHRRGTDIPTRSRT